jgi:salicylate hydroxylase
MSIELAIAGGGIGGLAAALACARAGCGVRVFEQAGAFSEAGAGIQLGPNATRVFERWQLMPRLLPCAALPGALVVRDAEDARELGRLPLGADFARRYGAPYLTLHRADLQHALLDAATVAGAQPKVESRVVSAHAEPDAVHAVLAGGETIAADALVAADGVWSSLRAQVVVDGPARSRGHFAFRGLALQSALPAALRSSQITVWLAPKMHVVSYPVRGGDELNVVVLVESPRAPSQVWDAVAVDSELLPAMRSVCPELHQLVEAMPGWGVWALHDRPPVGAPDELVRGRIALLGDAAHPMLPYLAQGAGMAIEDADTIASVLSDSTRDSVPAALQRYADARWRRCAQVQSRARRNAQVFHAQGPMRWARDAAMRAMGARLLDQPWLYAR